MTESFKECLEALKRARRVFEKLSAIKDCPLIDDSDLAALGTSLSIADEHMNIKAKQAEGGRKYRLTEDSPQILQALEFIEFRRGMLGPDPVADYRQYLYEQKNHGRDIKIYKHTQAREHLNMAQEIYKAKK